MIKLYVLYTVLGFYMLYYSLLFWFYPLDDAMLQVVLAVAASVVLYFIAPAICMYKPRIAPGTGLACLAAIAPFGIHWLQYKLADEYFIAWQPENIMLYAAVLWYLIALMVTINIYIARHNLKVKYYSKKVKLTLAFFPLAAFVVLILYCARR